MPARTTERLYGIDELAARLGTRESTLRFYESLFQGFLPPKIARGDRVFYTEEAAEIFQVVEELRKRGITRPVEVIPHIQARRHRGSQSPEPQKSRFGKVIVVTSGKGGVGKSNIALNLAISLVRQGKKTVLIDADLGLANLHILCGHQPERNLRHVVFDEVPIRDAVSPGPGGLEMISGGSGLAELANLGNHHRMHLISELERLEESYDCVVIDTSPGISRGVTDFVRIGDIVLLVTTPDLTSTTDAYAMLKTVLKTLRGTRIGVLCNRARTRGEASDIYTRLEICSRRFLDLDLESFGYLPEDRAVSRSNEIQRPFVLADPESRVSQYMIRLSERVLERRNGETAKTRSSFREMLSLRPDDPFLKANASHQEIRILTRD